MLFRLAQPMKRKTSRNHYFTRRIPADIIHRMVGMRLKVPVGDEIVPIIIGSKTKAIRISLRAAAPEEVKIRQAEVGSYIETVFQAVRSEEEVSLSHRQTVALSKVMYDAWSSDPDPSTVIAIELDENHEWKRVETSPEELGYSLEALQKRLEQFLLEDDPLRGEMAIGGLIDRVLLDHGIKSVDAASRSMLRTEFLKSLQQGIAVQSRKALRGDYRPDENAERFPLWEASQAKATTPLMSLHDLVERWWMEAEATGRSISTYESYSRVFRNLAKHLGHEDVQHLSKADIIAFKDQRMTQGVSAKTIKDSDLSALRSVFAWAVDNDLMLGNPAASVTMKRTRKTKKREPYFSETETRALLSACLVTEKRPRESVQRWAGRRWALWLCAYSGARIGEIIQMRKSDVMQVEGYWCFQIDPNAVTVKDKETRIVPLHTHLIDLGFLDYIEKASDGQLFMWTGEGRSAWRTAKNKISEFVREHIRDPDVQPNHAWRYTFKTLGQQAKIEGRILDDITGHEKDTVGKAYMPATITTMADAMKLFPKYETLSQPKEMKNGID